ncbi:hypothetical protein KKP91_03270 [Methanothermococcus sp. SCGC AD-155-M21]|nr:hypothetical protein [Methanothermococcus sp. SCGC AD-155-M21]
MYDFIIIGSGVGGSTLFKELNKKYPNKRILLLEKGDNKINYNTLGKTIQVLYMTSLGGSALGAVGNAIKIDLKKIGIGDKGIYEEIERELNVKKVPESHINEKSKYLFNHGFERTPKFMDFEGCNSCGLCARKLCQYKWTPVMFLANPNPHSKILSNFHVSSLKKKESFFTVEGYDLLMGRKRTFKGEKVIVCGGGINSPRILSSILDNEHLGRNLFVDTFITIGGILDNSHLDRSVPMALYKVYDGFLLSPHYSILLYNKVKGDNKYEGKNIGNKDIYGMMIKIRDENKGIIDGNKIYKEITKKDEKLLSRGIKKASDILYNMGLERIYKTVLRGSHPGGTCAMGKVVDKNFESEVEGLYVCDSSVFPETVGLPPILGIIAMGKKLANIL